MRPCPKPTPREKKSKPLRKPYVRPETIKHYFGLPIIIKRLNERTESIYPCSKQKQLAWKDSDCLVAQCDDLWREIIKAKAGYRSELSGKMADPENGIYLQSHHILQKPNRRLRYELENGICITKGEHNWGAHGGRQEEFRRKIQAIRGADIFDRLYLLKNQKPPDMIMLKIYLTKELEKLKVETHKGQKQAKSSSWQG